MMGSLFGAGGAFEGKWAFVAALAILIVWLLAMPKRFIGQVEGAPPWWRNVRFWAVVVASIQLFVYAYFG